MAAKRAQLFRGHPVELACELPLQQRARSHRRGLRDAKVDQLGVFDIAILGQVALGYCPFIDRSRNVTATRLTVFALRPDLPVALASGYVTPEIEKSAFEAGASALVYKPNDVAELCETVQRLILGKHAH